MKKIYTIVATAFLFAACKPNVNMTAPATPGNAVFTNYLAIGNSLTAGYADGSLYVSGQLNSYPERLFEQFTYVGAKGPFIQPLLTGDNGYPGRKKVLGITPNCLGDSSLGPIDYVGALDANDANPYVSPVNNGQINNIGVPGIRVVDYMVAGYGSLNLYAKRFYTNLAGTPMDELKTSIYNLHPTFFTLWLGANDVLAFASSGGEGDGTGTAAPLFGTFYGQTDISNYTAFKTTYDSIINVAVSVGSSGALINIPDVTAIPFFTTVPINGLAITRQSFADSLKAVYRFDTLNYSFAPGANYFIVQDHNGNTRQAVPGELLRLDIPMDSILCRGWGSIVPIPKKWVITTEELQQIRNATQIFNEYIAYEAQLHNLALVDMHTYLNTLSSGIAFNGIKYTASYVTGGAFSLDGVHLTPRGYALVANQIITAINTHYKSTVPLTDANKYQGVKFP